jgi:uncharacterized PurR-regulated membrane protein YhhQ (DUF165 family)
MLYLTIFVYFVSMIAANLLVAKFGPAITPINAFVFIGFDLSLKDFLQIRLNKTQMTALILATGFVSYLLNPATGIIAIASVLAFVVSSIVDWYVFSKTPGSWFKRANTSNLAGAAVDSLLFPAIAFGSLIPTIVVLQFLAKFCGGALWAFVINKFSKEDK